ncbi:flagellin [Paracoccus liaowanqingii]|uniref:Flagellin n=1 Tax=Paracoccus liaowanqingii TaxID=2560053 RepID=A0A4Z1C3G8_9RHOB|nr:flagellin [Paracoccus liaowanqingii]TGN60520.1 flagellin [Paracoccus liaowanqingii]
MTSILTNNSAMVALQTLKSVNAQLGKTQADIATGKSVANAKDSAAVWAISKVMETDQSAFKTIQSNLNVADAVVTTARTGAEKVVESLRSIKDLAAGAYNTATASEKAKITTDINLKFKEIASVINGTQMNGVNLLKSGTADLKVLASLDRGATVATKTNSISVATTGLDTLIGALGLDPAVPATFGVSTIFTATSLDVSADDTTNIGAFITAIETSISGVLEKTAQLGSYGKQLTGQAEFVGKLADSLKAGIGALVDADMEESSARLQALQTQQQLGIQSLSIANQAPAAIMALFRG